MQRVCTHRCIYFGSIKSKQNYSTNSRSKLSCKSVKSSDKQSTQPIRKVQPQRRKARRQKEVLSVMAFQELEWYAIDDVDFDGVKNDIPEFIHRPGNPLLDNIEPVWTDA